MHGHLQIWYIAHIINLAIQEILKYIKGDNAQEENDILMSGNDNIVDIIPKVRKSFYF